MNRKSIPKIILLAICFTLGILSLPAATITVMNNNDSGAGSLRQAVMDAAPGDDIKFAVSTNGMTIVLTSGDIEISKALTITGNGTANTQISGNNTSRIFRIIGASATIRNLTIMSGNAPAGDDPDDGRGGGIYAENATVVVSGVTITNCIASGNTATHGGGAIYNVGGMLTVMAGSLITMNAADGASGSGGGILNDAGGTLSTRNTTFSNNMASRAGGGIEDNSGAGTVTTLNVTRFEGNTTGASPGNGGAVHVTGAGDVNITASQVLNNVAAAEGGGLWNGTGKMVVLAVNIIGNRAEGDAADQGGGGLFNAGGTLRVRISRIEDNTASGAAGSGGGILNDAGGTLTVLGGSINNNSSVRAGGGIEDNSGNANAITLNNVEVNNNTTGAAPGNGGGLHITGPGGATITGGTFSGNTAAREGGGLWNGSGNMVVDGVTIQNNKAGGDAADDGGGGIFNNGGILMVRNGTLIDGNTADGAGGSGGGIFNATGGTLTAMNSTISNNTASRAGGGIEDNSGAGTVATLNFIRFEGNTTGASPGNGGALHVTGDGDVNITGCRVLNNSAAAEGGGLWNGTGTMVLNVVTVMGNQAQGMSADQGGGGVFNAGGTLRIRNSQIQNNTANAGSGSGGGILNDAGGTLTVFNTTLSNNSAMRAGGGIEDNSGNANAITLNKVNVVDNMTGAAPGNGGGLHITGAGGATITASTFTGNIATREGGGLWNGSGTMIVDGAIIQENMASGDAADDGGGGIFNNGGTLMVRNGTLIANNTADGVSGSGGGIFNATGGTLTVMNSTISGNMAMRAGGGIEDNSGAGTLVTLNFVRFEDNSTGANPGNGGALHVTGAGDVNITGSRVENNVAAAEGGGLWNGTGKMVLNVVTVMGNRADGAAADQGGGGLFNAGGVLRVRNSRIQDNIAGGAGGSGGGILNDVGGTLTVLRTTLSNNMAMRAGGAIEDNSGAGTTMTISNVTMSQNTTGSAPGNGGGVHITGAGDATVSNSNVLNNMAAAEGGGLWNGTGTMTVTSTTIDGNVASGNAADQGGGGVFNAGGTVNIVRSTISNNEADSGPGSGGGVFNDGGTMNVSFSTISGNTSANGRGGGILTNGMLDVVATTIAFNDARAGGGIMATAGTTALQSNIVAQNSSNSPGNDLDIEAGGMIVSNGYNLIGDDNAGVFTPSTGDLEGNSMGMGSALDPMLAPLAMNGGSTATHALLCGSPAINAGDPALVGPDQRGEPVFGPQRDMGSFELQEDCPPAVASPVAGIENNLQTPSTALSGSTVYPNPAPAGLIRIDIPASFGEEVRIRVMGMSGKVVYSEVDATIGTISMDLSHLTTGTYLVQIVAGQSVETHKLLINR